MSPGIFAWTGTCAKSDLNYSLPFVFLSVTTCLPVSTTRHNYCLPVSTTVCPSQLLFACLNYCSLVFSTVACVWTVTWRQMQLVRRATDLAQVAVPNLIRLVRTSRQLQPTLIQADRRVQVSH